MQPRHIPDPAGTYDTPKSRGLSDAAIIFIRQKFLNLGDFPDHIIRDMDFQTIHQLNVSIAAQADAKRKPEPDDSLPEPRRAEKKTHHCPGGHR